MEDVLEVYQRSYGDNEVLVCLDETSKQQVKETRVGRPAGPGAAAVYDYEYERNGVAAWRNCYDSSRWIRQEAGG